MTTVLLPFGCVNMMNIMSDFFSQSIFQSPQSEEIKIESYTISLRLSQMNRLAFYSVVVYRVATLSLPGLCCPPQSRVGPPSSARVTSCRST